MTLSSPLFTRDGLGKDVLRRCSESHIHNIYRGKQLGPGGKDAISRIQDALALLGYSVNDEAGVYGSGTARAVLAFKGPPRNILGPGQRVPDNVVGIQTIHRLDLDIQDKPAPTPQVEGSTEWNFAYFGHKRVLGDDQFRLRITSADNASEGQDFNIVEHFTAGDFTAGFTTTSQGRFTTPRKAKIIEFGSAATKMILAKQLFTTQMTGHMTIGTIGDDSRRMTMLLNLGVMTDRNLNAKVKSGIFEQHGTLRRA